MKAIVEYTKQEYAEMLNKLNELREKVKGTSSRDWFNNYTRTRGYAHYTFSGEITDKLIQLLGHEPSSDEIIMLVDNGFSHFGASCTINNRHFSGRVNVD